MSGSKQDKLSALHPTLHANYNYKPWTKDKATTRRL